MLKKLKKIVKKMLAISWVRKAHEGLTLGVLSIFASNRALATLYGWLGFLTFNREQYAVLKGRRNYYRNLKRNRQSHVELRRNIHRLEKGMIMQPRRQVFALNYIGETLEFYQQAISRCQLKDSDMDEGELEWAFSVLSRYFSIVQAGDQVVDAAKHQFEASKEIYRPKNTQKAPFARKAGVKSQVKYDDLLTLARQRRSVRWFQKKPVSRDLVDKALLVARQSPTACNRLPYQFKIFDDPKLVKQVANIPFGAGGYAHQIPTIAVVVGKLDSYFSPRDRHAIYVDASLAAMGFMYGLESVGLSSSVINWPDFEPLELKMQKTLNLDVSDRVVMLIAIGHADPKGEIPFSEKKSLDTLRSYNQEIN